MYRDVMEIAVDSPDRLGIRVHGVIPGMIPPYEEHAARRKAGYTLAEWRALDWQDRAIEVAMYRIEAKVEAMSAEEERERAKAKAG